MVDDEIEYLWRKGAAHRDRGSHQSRESGLFGCCVPAVIRSPLDLLHHLLESTSFRVARCAFSGSCLTYLATYVSSFFLALHLVLAEVEIFVKDLDVRGLTLTYDSAPHALPLVGG